ncbi:hypothetical protein AB0J90_07505 [Micromonospora sp. NPDC049523]|uniref:hypothetical protein n=1 Tax=Micromonospora sp. NPDC049523 TaxID=3155921 RepID=UPI00341935B2
MSVLPNSLTYWPGPANTGVPAGTPLTYSGPLDLTVDGQIVSNLDITGPVNVYANDVVIRRSRITCTGRPAIRTFGSATNLLVEDVEIDGQGQGGGTAYGDNYTLRRVDIHDVVDGPRLGSQTTVIDSWVHDLAKLPGSHNDTLATTGASGILVRHNRLDAYRDSSDDAMNACLALSSTSGPVRDLLFEDNYCNGGNYTIGMPPDLDAADVVFRGNSFGRNYVFGVIARPDHRGLTWERSNVWIDTGQAVFE